MKTSRFSDSQIIAILMQAEPGSPVRQLSPLALSRARHQFGDLLQVTRQIRRHGRVIDGAAARTGRGESTAQEDVRREAPQGRNHSGCDSKKVVKPSRRREMAQCAAHSGRVSVKLACLAFDVRVTCYRYQPRLSSENAEIADHLLRLTHNQRNCCIGLCFLYLCNVKGYRWNHKRVYRIYRKLALNLRIKPRKSIVREKPEPLAMPETINHCWSMDFMHEQLADGRSFRMLNLLDDCNRGALAMDIDLPLPTERVTRPLDQLIEGNTS